MQLAGIWRYPPRQRSSAEQPGSPGTDQERRRRRCVALHGGVRADLADREAVGAIVLAAGVAGLVVPLDVLKIVVASILVMLGLHRLWRHRHPRFGGMQVGFRDLAVWSFLMASAHGAGLMLLPWVMTMPSDVS